MPLDMFGLLGKSSEIRRLNRDASAIIKADTRAYDEAHLRSIATQIKAHLERSRREIAGLEPSQSRLLADIKSRHQEARKRQDQTALSALTLVIIYLRSTELGEACQPAIDSIDRFLDEWC